MALRKTTIWLSDRETAALRYMAALSGRSHSELIRSAVRLLAASARWDQHSRQARRQAHLNRPLKWRVLTDDETRVMILEKMGCSPDQIASELRLFLEQVGRHLKALAEWRRSRQEEAGG